jgi:hypothetical protein
MKKFTKIILIIAGSLAALGIVFSGIAAVMGAGWSTIHRKALAGEFDFGNWHIGNGVYYAYDQGHGILDHFWDDDYDDDDDWDDEDWATGIMTTGMMRMTSSWMIIGRWRVLVHGS